jgi:hypothetical protein
VLPLLRLWPKQLTRLIEATDLFFLYRCEHRACSNKLNCSCIIDGNSVVALLYHVIVPYEVDFSKVS